jgi:hypothetical protein
MQLHRRTTFAALPLLMSSLLSAALFLAGPGPAPLAEEFPGPGPDKTCRRCGAAHAGGWDTRPDAGAAKIDPETAEEETCGPPAATKGSLMEPFLPLTGRCGSATAGDVAAGKRTSVAALVQTALADQARLLEGKALELGRWDARDRAMFFKWFGTTEEEARAIVARRVAVEQKLNELYSVRNFRRAPHRPGVFAFVHPTDPSKVFVDMAFVRAPRIGENSRAGTIAHEMSHFLVAGGTKDHAYGTAKCRHLARSNPALALTNADNFEFWVENAR